MKEMIQLSIPWINDSSHPNLGKNVEMKANEAPIPKKMTTAKNEK